MYKALNLEALLERFWKMSKTNRSQERCITYTKHADTQVDTRPTLTDWSKIVNFHRDELPRDEQSASMAVPYC